jgi:hypothetical protein
MILALIIDDAGRAICTEMWPGNTVDITTRCPSSTASVRRAAPAE